MLEGHNASRMSGTFNFQTGLVPDALLLPDTLEKRYKAFSVFEMGGSIPTLILSMENSTSLIFSSRSDVQLVDPSQVPEFVRDYVLHNYFQIAILTVLVYDAGKCHVARRDLTLTIV